MSEVAAAYSLPLSEGDTAYLKHRILSKTKKVGDCLHWGGETYTSGYGAFRFTFSKKRYKVRVHRFLFFITNNFDLTSDSQVSHICHHKTCINLDHLSLEDAGVNMQRLICFNAVPQHCIGHGDARHCIFEENEVPVRKNKKNCIHLYSLLLFISFFVKFLPHVQITCFFEQFCLLSSCIIVGLLVLLF